MTVKKIISQLRLEREGIERAISFGSAREFVKLVKWRGRGYFRTTGRNGRRLRTLTVRHDERFVIGTRSLPKCLKQCMMKLYRGDGKGRASKRSPSRVLVSIPKECMDIGE